MNSQIKDIKNKRFGRLFVIEFAGIKKERAHWLCMCDCGKTTTVHGSKLRNGHTQSCGCLVGEKIAAFNTTHGYTNKISEYGIWAGMRQRCLNIKCKEYKYYGGRGIKICERWLNSFENFFSDMGSRPSKLHSIERINNDKDYEPSNCKWATQREQCQNRSTSRWLEYNGEKKILSDWARELNVGIDSLRLMIKRHSVYEAISIYKQRINI